MVIKNQKSFRHPSDGQPKASINSEIYEISEDIIRHIVDMGTMAPSADNCQPWKFTWDKTTLTLRSDPKRTGFFYDINEESTLMTLGAVLENISTAATHYGLTINYNLKPSNLNEITIEITFQNENCPEDPLYSFIPLRKTNRLPFIKKSTTQTDKEKLTNICNNYSNQSLFLFEDNESKKTFKKIIFDADRILFENKDLHQGLFKWIWMEKDSVKKDGMDLSVLGIKGLQKKIFPLFGSWRILSWGNKIGMSMIPGINSLLLLKNTPTYGMLTTTERNQSGYIESGRTMEKLWVSATSLGLAVHPMAGFTFLLNHYVEEKACRFSEKHREMIKTMINLYNKTIGPIEENYPVMFFRIGQPKKITNKSSRRELEEVFSIIK